MQFIWDRLCVRVFGGAVTLLLVACGGDTSTPLARNSAAVTLTGTILDGPVVDADLEVTDAAGDVVARGSSDAAAGFQVVVPPGTAYPITLHSRAGIDLVTQAAPDIPLELIIADPSQTIGNVTSLSTLAARVAKCAAGLPDPEQVERAWMQVREQLAMGYDESRFGDPRRVPLDAVNIAAAVVASEGFAETVRRTVDALSTTADARNASELMNAIACDLHADSLVDGHGGVAARPRVAAAFSAASAGVLVEIASGKLHVAGANATLEMDRAIATMIPDAGATIGVVPLTGALLRQAREALIRVAVGLDDNRVVPWVAMLDQVPLAALPDALDLKLAPGELALLTDLPRRAAGADDATLARANAVAREIGGSLPPLISFAAKPEQVPLGGVARFSWAAVNAAHCWASGDWSGARGADGTLVTPPLDRTVTYRLDCIGIGGTSTSTVSANVAGAIPRPTEVATTTPVAPPSQSPATPAPPATPRPVAPPPPVAAVPVNAALTATPMWLSPGATTTLRWSSTGATECAGSGGWSGNKSPSGSSVTGPINADTTFTLRCGGATGTALATSTVSTRTARLTWQPPSLSDGSATVAGYRVRYGTASNVYSATVQVNDPSQRQTTLTLAPGTYYFVMIALDSAGNETARSNEVSKTIG